MVESQLESTCKHEIEEPEGGEGSHQGHAGPLGTWLTASNHEKHMLGTRLKSYFRPHRWDRMIYVVGLGPFSLDSVKQQAWAEVAGKRGVLSMGHQSWEPGPGSFFKWDLHL